MILVTVMRRINIHHHTRHSSKTSRRQIDMVLMETDGPVETLSLQIKTLANSRPFSSDLSMSIEVKDRKEETIPFLQKAFNQGARILDNLYQMTCLIYHPFFLLWRTPTWTEFIVLVTQFPLYFFSDALPWLIIQKLSISL